MMSASVSARGARVGSKAVQAAVAAVVAPAPGSPQGHRGALEGRETFEKLTRIVDVLESRVAAAERTHEKATAPVPREWESAARHALEAAERILNQAEDRERHSQQVTAQLAQILGDVRTSYEGVRTLCSEAKSLKKDIAALYDRLGARMDQMRKLLVETQNLAIAHHPDSPGALGAKSSLPMAMPRAQVVRPAARGATAIGSPTPRSAAAQDISRGVAQLLTLVDNRKRQAAEGLNGSSARPGSVTGAVATGAARLTREVNQLLSLAS